MIQETFLNAIYHYNLHYNTFSWVFGRHITYYALICNASTPNTVSCCWFNWNVHWIAFYESYIFLWPNIGPSIHDLTSHYQKIILVTKEIVWLNLLELKQLSKDWEAKLTPNVFCGWSIVFIRTIHAPKKRKISNNGSSTCLNNPLLLLSLANKQSSMSFWSSIHYLGTGSRRIIILL